MPEIGNNYYEFGPFRLDVRARRLLRNGEPLPLTPKDFETLLLLVINRSRVVTKAELMKTLWPESFVEEANLTQHVFTLRKALGDQSDGKPYIDNIPRLGYRFTAPVREAVEAPASPPLPAFWRRRRMAAYATLAAGTLTAALYVGWRSLPASVESPGAQSYRSIAVLPFKALSPDSSEQDLLGLGLADALITKLASVRTLTVRPTNAVRRYAGTHDAVKAGRELKVQAVLDGSIQRDGNTLRVTAQLISVSNGGPIWTATFDTVWTNIFAVQDAISQQLADALSLQLTADEKRGLTKRHTNDAVAYEAYLKSRYFWNKRTREGYVKGIQYAKDAIARDPGYALAHAALADSYALIGPLTTESLSRDQAITLARAAASQAISLDETLAEAHTSLAFVKMHYDWDWEGAEKAFRRAIELNPSYPTAFHWYAYCLTATRRHEEAIAAITRAHELDPLSLIISTDVAEVRYYARQYDRAIEQARRTLDMDPAFPLARRVLGWALQERGQYETALVELRRIHPEQGPGFLGHLYATAGQPAQARRILAEIRDRSPKYGSTYEVALVYAGLGDTERALTYLERSHQERQGMILLAVDPHFDRVRTHPRFVALLRQMRLPTEPLTQQTRRPSAPD
jgi:DNA-binding winged helix-turn-helix (wHTH) protein/TolB-like protein